MASTCVVQLRDGDTLASLAGVYGISAQEICALNGIAWNKQAIDAWVMTTGGRRLPFVASEPYDAVNKIGWAVFTGASKIKLPVNGPRACYVTTTEVLEPTESSSSWGWWALAGVAFGGAMLLSSKKKKGD